MSQGSKSKFDLAPVSKVADEEDIKETNQDVSAKFVCCLDHCLPLKEILFFISVDPKMLKVLVQFQVSCLRIEFVWGLPAP